MRAVCGTLPAEGKSMTLGWAAFYLAALYLAAGAVFAAVFVTYGAPRALPEPIPVSLGARLLLIPGAIVLWPIVLRRWLGPKHA
jgi:hypothetical protein